MSEDDRWTRHDIDGNGTLHAIGLEVNEDSFLGEVAAELRRRSNEAAAKVAPDLTLPTVTLNTPLLGTHNSFTDFDAKTQAFLGGLRDLTERTGIVVSAEAMEGENAQVTLAIRPKGDGWYRYVDGALAWRSAADHDAEIDRLRSEIRAAEQALAALESESAK
jgi:hypothetical protein